MKRPSVVFVNRYFHPDVSATSQMLFDLARRLSARGIRVQVLCSQQLYEDAAARLPAVEQVEGIQVRRLATTRFGRARLWGRALDYLSFYVLALFALLWRLRRGDVVVAKTDPPLISVVVALAARLRGAHLVNWLQDIFPEVASHLDANPLPRPLDRLLRAVRNASLRGAAFNVVLGRRMRDYVETLGVAAQRIRVIENWADGETVQPMPASASRLRRQLELQDKFVVGYSGNLGRAHDYRSILDAATVLAGDSSIVFLMIGGGANMTRLKDEAAQRHLDNFRFLPYQPRSALSDSLAAADVHLACLLPALEGLIVPSKFYGILAAARPILFIGDRAGELARIIGENGCGASVSNGDAVALVREIRALQSDPLVAAEMGRRAVTLFRESCTADRAAAQWLELLSTLDVFEPLAPTPEGRSIPGQSAA